MKSWLTFEHSGSTCNGIPVIVECLAWRWAYPCLAWHSSTLLHIPHEVLEMGWYSYFVVVLSLNHHNSLSELLTYLGILSWFFFFARMFVNLLGNWSIVNFILIYLFACVVVTVQGLSSITGVVNKKFCNLCNLPELVTLCWYLFLTRIFFTSWKNLQMFWSPHLESASYFHNVQNESQLGERFPFYPPQTAWPSLTKIRLRRFIL